MTPLEKLVDSPAPSSGPKSCTRVGHAASGLRPLRPRSGAGARSKENGRTAGARFRLRPPGGQSLPGHFPGASALGETLPEAEAVGLRICFWGFARREGEEHKVLGERERADGRGALGLLERGWVVRKGPATALKSHVPQ